MSRKGRPAPRAHDAKIHDAPPGDTGVPGLAARAVAVDAVVQVLKSRAALEDVLDRLLAPAGLDLRDAALARAIATVAFRRYGSLNHVVNSRLEQGAVASARLSALLVSGAAQILHMDVPDRAAVDVAVQIARDDASLRPFSGLVNAVLRRIAREREIIAALDDPLLDLPPWLRQRWQETYGDANTLAMALAHRQGASVDISLKRDPGYWAAALNADILVTGSVRLRDKTPVHLLPGFEQGDWWIQDAAATLPVRLLAPRAGERIADLCAAPGGKTAQIAASGAEVVAVDRSQPRLRRLADNMQRLGFKVTVQVADILAMPIELYDGVLLDAPCSATGTLRRHPEIAWIKTQSDIARLAELQLRLLDRAAELTRPGGRLIYCTCSLEPEEGERQIEAFLSRHPEFERVAVGPEETGLPQAITPEGDLRTLPSMTAGVGLAGVGLAGMDGFFSARLRKSNEKESIN